MEYSPVAADPPRRDARWVFIGPDGIRAGWGMLLFVAIFAGFAYLTTHLAQLILKQMGTLPPLPGPRLGLLQESTVIIPTVAATAVVAWIERRSVWSYGLTDPLRLRRFATGVFWGFVALSFLIGILFVTGHIKEDGPELHAALAVRMAVEWFAMFAAVGVAEEMLLRGYLQYTLARGIGFWWAAIVLSVLFGLSHGTNPGENPTGLIAAGFAGFVFAYSLYRTGSLFWAIGAHAGWDWAQSYFYGTADSGFNVYGHLFGAQPLGPTWLSGGKDGPEGSIFVFLAFAVLIPIIRYTLPRTGAFSAGAPPTTHTPPTGA
jgi:membrane protease YdiL (CAAX protease family)